MPEIPWPVDLVNADTGDVWQVGSMRELNEVRFSGPWLLRRPVPGLDMAAAAPSRAEVPREPVIRRGAPAEAAPPPARSSKSSRKA